MPFYEYKVIPAPSRGEKARGAKTTAERFAVALTSTMNSLGRDGWEYVRADTLPCEERVGFTSKTTTFQHLLVFRRPLPDTDAPRDTAAAEAPQVLALTAVASEGAAPRLGAANGPETPVMPPLGPARGNGRAADLT